MTPNEKTRLIQQHASEISAKDMQVLEQALEITKLRVHAAELAQSLVTSQIESRKEIARAAANAAKQAAAASLGTIRKLTTSLESEQQKCQELADRESGYTSRISILSNALEREHAPKVLQNKRISNEVLIQQKQEDVTYEESAKRERAHQRRDYDSYRALFTSNTSFRLGQTCNRCIRSPLDRQLTYWTEAVTLFRESEFSHLIGRTHHVLDESLRAYIAGRSDAALKAHLQAKHEQAWHKQLDASYSWVAHTSRKYTRRLRHTLGPLQSLLQAQVTDVKELALAQEIWQPLDRCMHTLKFQLEYIQDRGTLTPADSYRHHRLARAHETLNRLLINVDHDKNIRLMEWLLEHASIAVQRLFLAQQAHQVNIRKWLKRSRVSQKGFQDQAGSKNIARLIEAQLDVSSLATKGLALLRSQFKLETIDFRRSLLDDAAGKTDPRIAAKVRPKLEMLLAGVRAGERVDERSRKRDAANRKSAPLSRLVSSSKWRPATASIVSKSAKPLKSSSRSEEKRAAARALHDSEPKKGRGWKSVKLTPVSAVETLLQSVEVKPAVQRQEEQTRHVIRKPVIALVADSSRDSKATAKQKSTISSSSGATGTPPEVDRSTGGRVRPRTVSSKRTQPFYSRGEYKLNLTPTPPLKHAVLLPYAHSDARVAVWGNEEDAAASMQTDSNQQPHDSNSLEDSSIGLQESSSTTVDHADGVPNSGTSAGPNLARNLSQETDAPLSFHIPLKDLRTAMLSSPNSNGAYWRHSLYKNPSGEGVTTFLCRKFEKSEQAAQRFLGEKVLGFDIEWESKSRVELDGIKDNVSLIQIASENSIALFQLAAFHGNTIEELMPPTLRHILESPDIIKAGVNIAADFTRMKRCLGIEGRGIFELSHLYKIVTLSESAPERINRKVCKLSQQVQDVLLLPLAKGDVRTSAWSKQLTSEQAQYAATDAYAGFRLFHALEERRKAMRPMPPRPAFHELQLPLMLGNGQIAGVRPRKGKDKRDDQSEIIPLVPAKGDTYPANQDCGSASSTPALEDEEDVQNEDEIEDEDEDDGKNYGQDEEEDEDKNGNKDEHEHTDGNNANDDNFDNAFDHDSNLSTANADAQQRLELLDPSDGPSPPTPHTNPAYIRAEDWVTAWRANLPPGHRVRANSQALRAYALWHHDSLSLAQVATMLRNPPLQRTTVAMYLCEAVSREDLPYAAEKLREAFRHLPPAAHVRYRHLMSQLDLQEDNSRRRIEKRDSVSSFPAFQDG